MKRPTAAALERARRENITAPAERLIVRCAWIIATIAKGDSPSFVEDRQFRDDADALVAALNAWRSARGETVSTPGGGTIRHRDGDPHNNAVGNLEVVPATDE